MDEILKQLKAQETSFVPGDETVYSKGSTTSPIAATTSTSTIKEKAPTHQISTIGFLFIFFGLIFLISYLVHRAGGPHKVEAAIDRFFTRAKNVLTGSKGGYSVLNHGSSLPR
ncbi:hypothetical protein CBS101457_002761 [Exobasidium rhododendri]|nr:hypothetical protein CBS101457_002761 [Exobasidium rhododendri]